MEIALTLVILIFSAVVHEVAHGYAANSLGDPTARLAGRLTINPAPHIDLIGSIVIPAILVLSGSSLFFGWAKPVPYNPYNLRNHRWGEFFVALSGSAVNLLLAILFGLWIRFFGGAFPESAVSLAAVIVFVNLFLGIFNLIPFPPLDGFSVLRSIPFWRLSALFAWYEGIIRGAGVFSLIAFLLVFSFALAGPFSRFILWLFNILTGGTV